LGYAFVSWEPPPNTANGNTAIISATNKNNLLFFIHFSLKNGFIIELFKNFSFEQLPLKNGKNAEHFAKLVPDFSPQ
jgi:hypothetical protein